MGLAQIAMAQEHAKDNLSFANCKHVGFIKTSSINDYITDSAAGATAFSTGKKTKNKYLAVDSSKKPLPTILELAHKEHWYTALAATATLTHATPAAYYAHHYSRYAYKHISSFFYNSGIDIAVGAGRPFFSEDSLKLSGYDIFSGVEEMLQSQSLKYTTFLTDSAELLSIPEGRGSVFPKAVDKLLKDCYSQDKPFFSMIEGSQIDWGGHANNANYTIQELLDFDKCIGIALKYLEQHPNTLVLVTADHETGGLTLLKDENKEMKPDFSTKKHSGVMVPVFAFGQGAEQFIGIYENTEIFHRLKALMELK